MDELPPRDDDPRLLMSNNRLGGTRSRCRVPWGASHSLRLEAGSWSSEVCPPPPGAGVAIPVIDPLTGALMAPPLQSVLAPALPSSGRDGTAVLDRLDVTFGAGRT